MSQLQLTLEQIREAREEAREGSPGYMALQHARAERELRRFPIEVKAFLRNLLPEVSTKRVCTVLGIENLSIPHEVSHALNPEERFALYLVKGNLSWIPYALGRFQNMYRGPPEDLILEINSYADKQLLDGKLGGFPKSGAYRVMPLETRLEAIPRPARILFERGFFTRVEDSYEKYNRITRLRGDELIDRIYEAVTSSS